MSDNLFWCLSICLELYCIDLCKKKTTIGRNGIARVRATTLSAKVDAVTRAAPSDARWEGGGRSKCALSTHTALLPSVLRLHCAEAEQATPHRAVVFFKQAVVSRLGSPWMEGQLHEEMRGGFNGSLPPPKKHNFYPSHVISYLLRTPSKWDDNTWVSARCIAFPPEICSC